MTNKKVAELVSEYYCLRDADHLDVEFLFMEGFYEVYKCIDYIEDFGVAYVGSVTNIRETYVVIKKDKIVHTAIIADWNDLQGRPEVDETTWYNMPSYLIYEASMKGEN